MGNDKQRLHATTVSLAGEGVLIRGKPGSGKSDLALRLIDAGAELVADDYTDIEITNGNAVAHAPKSIRGLLEVRGLGVVRVGCVESAAVHLIVDLGTDAVMRLPEHEHEALAGVAVARIDLNAFEASAAAKVRMALKATRENLFVDDANINDDHA